MKKLLVGNGLNLAARNDNLNSKEIAKRFFHNIIRSLPLLNYLSSNSLVLTCDELQILTKYCLCDNIERVADKTFFYFKSHYKDFSDTDQWNLVQFMKALAIDAIFYVENVFKKTEIKSDSKLGCSLFSYEKIYTLNYHEGWDDGRCCYLHGYYSPHDPTFNKKPIMIIFEDLFMVEREKDPAIDEIFSELCNDNYIVSIPANEIMSLYFIGDSFNKQLSSTLYPTVRTYPSDMLFVPLQNRVLYENFDVLPDEQLFIFGMSPSGDKELIEKISKINDVTVFIYNLACKQEEAKVWRERIKHIKIYDDNKFYSN